MTEYMHYDGRYVKCPCGGTAAWVMHHEGIGGRDIFTRLKVDGSGNLMLRCSGCGRVADPAPETAIKSFYPHTDEDPDDEEDYPVVGQVDTLEESVDEHEFAYEGETRLKCCCGATIRDYARRVEGIGGREIWEPIEPFRGVVDAYACGECGRVFGDGFRRVGWLDGRSPDLTESADEEYAPPHSIQYNDSTYRSCPKCGVLLQGVSEVEGIGGRVSGWAWCDTDEGRLDFSKALGCDQCGRVVEPQEPYRVIGYIREDHGSDLLRQGNSFKILDDGGGSTFKILRVMRPRSVRVSFEGREVNLAPFSAQAEGGRFEDGNFLALGFPVEEGIGNRTVINTSELYCFGVLGQSSTAAVVAKTSEFATPWSDDPYEIEFTQDLREGFEPEEEFAYYDEGEDIYCACGSRATSYARKIEGIGGREGWEIMSDLDTSGPWAYACDICGRVYENVPSEWYGERLRMLGWAEGHNPAADEPPPYRTRTVRESAWSNPEGGYSDGHNIYCGCGAQLTRGYARQTMYARAQEGIGGREIWEPMEKGVIPADLPRGARWGYVCGSCGNVYDSDPAEWFVSAPEDRWKRNENSYRLPLVAKLQLPPEEPPNELAIALAESEGDAGDDLAASLVGKSFIKSRHGYRIEIIDALYSDSLNVNGKIVRGVRVICRANHEEWSFPLYFRGAFVAYEGIGGRDAGLNLKSLWAADHGILRRSPQPWSPDDVHNAHNTVEIAPSALAEEKIKNDNNGWPTCPCGEDSFYPVDPIYGVGTRVTGFEECVHDDHDEPNHSHDDLPYAQYQACDRCGRVYDTLTDDIVGRYYWRDKSSVVDMPVGND